MDMLSHIQLSSKCHLDCIVALTGGSLLGKDTCEIGLHEKEDSNWTIALEQMLNIRPGVIVIGSIEGVKTLQWVPNTDFCAWKLPKPGQVTVTYHMTYSSVRFERLHTIFLESPGV